MAVAPSAIEGQGLFATGSIYIAGGRVVSDDELTTIVREEEGRYSTLAIGVDLNLLQDDDDPNRYGTHSCDPNLWLADAVTLVARRTIEVAEELTTAYATMTGFADWSMKCSCASERCRGTVTGADWKVRSLQARYRGHFSPFLNDRISSSSS